MAGRPPLIADDDLRRLVGSGLSDIAIANRRGCSIDTVARRRKQIGIYRHAGRKPLVNVDPREAARMQADGYCFGCIARKLGATTAHIRYLLREREA